MSTDKSLNKLIQDKDISGPHEAFELLYDKSSDNKKLQQILTEVKKYDVIDFIARVSALNLIPENQNKSILLDSLIASLLTLKRSEYIFPNKMSNGKFRKVISQINSMDLKMSIDPAENIFIENVMFYGNYFIFNGINYLPGYSIQMMINTLYLHKNNFNVEFLKTVSKLIRLVLSISNVVATKLGYKLEDLNRIEKSNIVVPDGKKLEQMAKLITIDNNYIQSLVDDNSMLGDLYSDFGQGDIETALNGNQQIFFVKPFLKSEDNRTVILNISILSSFLLHKIICLANEYGYKEELINQYNISVWLDCRRSLKALGHKKIKEDDWKISLLDRNDYKEVLLNVCNNQVMIVTFICDDGKNYTNDTIFDMYPSDHLNEIIKDRTSYLYGKLSQQNIKNEDVFHIIIINSFGRGIEIRLHQRYYIPLAFNPYDLRCISINERSNLIFLPRYIRAKNKLHTVPSLFCELNTIEVYVKNQYSFYVNDDFNPQKNMLYIGAGESIEYISRAINKEKRHLTESYKEGYYTEVILNDEVRNIFTDLSLDIPRASLLAEFSNVSIWIYSAEIDKAEGLNLYFSIVDTLSYWLEECKEIIESYNFEFDLIKLQVKLIGNLNEYYYQTEEKEKSWIDEVGFKINKNTITLSWNPEAFRALNCKDNSIEKQMIESILDVLGNFTEEGNIEKKQLDNIFANPLKKKIFTFDYINNPYLKPVSVRIFRKIKSEDENELLDDIGSAILSSNKWSYGIIKDNERSRIAKFVVGYLYKTLQNQVAECY